MVLTNKKGLACPNCHGMIGITTQTTQSNRVLTYDFSKKQATNMDDPTEYGCGDKKLVSEGKFECVKCTTTMEVMTPNPLIKHDSNKTLLRGKNETYLYGLDERKTFITKKSYSSILQRFVSKNNLSITYLHLNDDEKGGLMVLITQSQLSKLQNLLSTITREHIEQYVIPEQQLNYGTIVYKTIITKKCLQLMRALQR